MDSPVAANTFGTVGAVLWSLQRSRRPSSWPGPFAGVPLGVYNIVQDFNYALQVQPNILIFLSLVAWAQCKYYGETRWGGRRIAPSFASMAMVLGGVETGLVFALRVADRKGQRWAVMLMAIVAAILLAGGVLRHYVSMFRSRSDAGLSLKFALLDAGGGGDVGSLLSMVFQARLSILGLVIYGSELVIWLGLMGIVLYFRVVNRHKQR
ncbi:hypothetical protein D0866_13589 [Hortaea werneckii]|uniref:PQ loop repeat protein n=1 Tax=Hortaea werneckii TaxID=91943 RepID=A0A3M6ZP15_HORWE|nr:hypothetical protein D0866_13589 [Hortaea werneckii]